MPSVPFFTSASSYLILHSHRCLSMCVTLTSGADSSSNISLQQFLSLLFPNSLHKSWRTKIINTFYFFLHAQKNGFLLIPIKCEILPLQHSLLTDSSTKQTFVFPLQGYFCKSPTWVVLFFSFFTLFPFFFFSVTHFTFCLPGQLYIKHWIAGSIKMSKTIKKD